MNELVGGIISVTVAVAVAVNVEVGMLVRVNGVKLTVGGRAVGVMLGVVVSAAVTVGVGAPGLIIIATPPRQ